MLTAGGLIDRAGQIAKVRGMTDQALDFLNTILSDLCEQYDFALARGLFAFNFNPSLITNFGSGPYTLPLDYLRTSGSSGSTGAGNSSWWTLQGVAYPMVPIDLSEFDMQVQQAGMQSYPVLWATDMGGPLTDRIVLVTTGDTHSNQTLDNLASTANLAVGQGVAGEGVVPGTTITALSGTTATLSTSATATATGASVFFGVPPKGFAYPPPSGAYAVQIRYQRMMPPIQDTSKVPWFPNEGMLLDMLSARLMQISGDSREQQYRNNATAELTKYLRLKDDSTNRASTVQLDRRNFGKSFRNLPNTKFVGW